MTDLPTRVSKQVADFLTKLPAMARLAFIVDATGSRQPTWDTASALQARMFQAAGGLGSLQVQLIYFRGLNELAECRASAWTSNASELSRLMSRIDCRHGETQIVKALDLVKREHAREPVKAVVYIGDMCEEKPDAIAGAISGLGVQCFLFMEGHDPNAEPIFRSMARLTNGAFARFEPGAEATLAELLRAAVAYAVGGLTALADQRTDAAKLLLTQMKKKG
jgi:hypothetical protein